MEPMPPNMTPTIATAETAGNARSGTIVLYHASCTDGFTAAWCAWLKYGDDAEYIPVQYGDDPPDVTGKDVLILDFSYRREVLLEMAGWAKSVRVLDHHRTAQRELDGMDGMIVSRWENGERVEEKQNLSVTFDMERSGAGLAWDELYGGGRAPLVDYVEDRDLWRWKLSASREISAWIGSFEYDFATWNELHRELHHPGNFPGIVQSGAAILRSADRHVASMVENAGRAIVGGFIVPFINTTSLTSEIVGRLAEDASFACGWFQRKDGKLVYSLRSRGNFDVSAIAKEYGGGGHAAAAGFTLDHLIPVETP